MDRLPRLFQWEPVRNQPGQIKPVLVPLKHQLRTLILNLFRRAVRPNQKLLVHADRRRIDHRLPMLGLRKQQHTPARARRIHRRLDQRVSAHRQNHRIGAPPFARIVRKADHILPPGIDRATQSIPRRHLVPLGKKIRRQHPRSRARRKSRKQNSDRALSDNEHCFIRFQRKVLNRLEACIHRLNERCLLKRNPIRNLHQPAPHDPFHHAHILRKPSARRLKSRRAAHLLVHLALCECLLAAVIALPARNVMKDHHAVANGKSFDTLPDRRNRPCRLMPENSRRRMRSRVNLLQVSPANPACRHTQQHLTRPNLRHRNSLNAHVIHAAVHGRAHTAWNSVIRHFFSIYIAFGTLQQFRQTSPEQIRQPTRRFSAVFPQALHRRPILRPHRNMRHQRRHPQLSYSIDKATEVRNLIQISIRNSLEAIKRNIPLCRNPRHSRGLHTPQHRLVLLRQPAFLIRPSHVIQRNQPITFSQLRRKRCAIFGIDHLGNRTRRRRLHRACQRTRPSVRNKRIETSTGKHPLRGSLHTNLANPSGDGHGLAITNATRPHVRPSLLPAPNQRLKLARQRRDNGNLLHVTGAYPCARNHSIADRKASYTGTPLNPSPRSAFAEDANIFFLPIRTASTVALGSRPRIRPVTVSSKNANVIATPCGTFIVGEGSPVIADILSRICFSVRFSPPRMYRSPGFPFSSASQCVFATSSTSTRFSPVSTYAGNFLFRKSTTMRPVGVGFTS